MESVKDLFFTAPLLNLQRIAIFRCKKGNKFNESYRRNVDWIEKGWTGWWSIKDGQEFDGMVVLLDSLKGRNIEIWAGKAGQPNSGRLERRSDDKKWKLSVAVAFEFLGLIQKGSVEKFMGGQIGTGVTYVERSPIQKTPSINIKNKISKLRGFNPEFTGDKEKVSPGSYTPKSDHGRLMKKLYEWLKTQNFSSLDNQMGRWDLHGFSQNGNAHLFEAKTDCTTSSIYSAVGQLKIYELDAGASLKWAVLPSEPETIAKWKDKLMRLDIGLITYDKNTGIFLETEGRFRLDKGIVI